MSSTIKVNNIQNLAGDDSGFDLSTNDKIGMKIANSEVVTVDTTGVVFNDGSADRDFRVESDNLDDAFFVQGSDGNVGIGTNSPSDTLDVERATGVVTLGLQSRDSSDTRIQFGDNSDGDVGIINYAHSDNTMRFTVNASEAMRISSNGHVGIGTSSSTYPLVISTGGSVAQLQLARPTDGSHRAILLLRSSSQGADVGNISVTNSATAYNTSSDYRLKENVTYDFDATTRLKQLKPSRFNFKVDTDTTLDGFLAHEVSSIVPEAITGTKDEVDTDGKPVYQGIDQSKLVPLLTKALQEAVAKIETLEAKVKALEGK